MTGAAPIVDLGDALAVVAGLSPLVEANADWADEHRRPARPVMEAFAAAGLLRLLAPRAYGGIELSLPDFVRVVEAVAAVDGSAGWTVMTANEELEIASAYLPPETLTVMLADRPHTIVAGSGLPSGRARRVEGGWVIDGRWRFVTGSPTAERIVVSSVVQTEARPRPMCYVLVPAGDVTIEDTWRVAGLRGTGSNDVVADGMFVPDRWAGVAAADATGLPDAPFYRLPSSIRFPFPKVGVAAGIARAAIAAFVELAVTKVPVGGKALLRERPAAAHAMSRATALRGSGWAYALEHANRLWDVALRGDPVPVPVYAEARLAAASAVHACVQAVEVVCEAAGSTVNFLDSPLERLFRDVHAVQQHYTVAPYRIDTAGRVLLGLEPDDLSF